MIKCKSYRDKLWENYEYAVWIFVIQITIRMRGSSKSPRQVAMIAYVVRHKQFFAHVAVRGAVKFLPIISYEICHENINR